MSKPKNVPFFFTVPEAAEYCGVSRNTMYTWARSGKVKSFLTPGRTNKIRPSDLVDFMKDSGMYVEPALLERAAEDRASEQAAIRMDAAHIDILIVDDDARNRTLIKRAVHDHAYAEAETGFECLHILTQHPEVQIVLLDLRMPGQHGLQTLKEIHRLAPSARVIIVTAHAGEIPSTLLTNGSIFRLLEKPFAMEDLLKAVHQILPVAQGDS